MVNMSVIVSELNQKPISLAKAEEEFSTDELGIVGAIGQQVLHKGT